MELGINYEGHKVTVHALRLGCRAALNLQIAMDAPFAGQVADESCRARGRSEQRFPGFRPDRLALGVARAVAALSEACARLGVGELVVQIARGRSAEAFEAEVVEPALAGCGLAYRVRRGYRSETWPGADELGPGAGFLNIGMFARLAGSGLPGEPFACVAGESVGRGADGRLVVLEEPGAAEQGAVLDAGLPHVRLLGIADEMPFVTPADYDEAELMSLFGDEAAAESTTSVPKM